MGVAFLVADRSGGAAKLGGGMKECLSGIIECVFEFDLRVPLGAV